MTCTVLTRRARHDDQHTVWRLSQLDSAPALQGEVLLGICGDRAIAAISVDDGRVVADPFTYSAAAVELLRDHADSLRGGTRGRRRRRAQRRARLRLASQSARPLSGAVR